MRRVAFAELRTADLVVDAVYESDATRQNVAADPIAPLTGTGNMGGFRFSGSVTRQNLVVLYTTMGEPNWPDAIDQENGLLVYFGDNRKPGFELHDRRAGRGGNGILRDSFERAHLDAGTRAEVPPFLVFSKAAKGRDVVFRGLAAPGASHLDPSSDLVAIWKAADGERFQNYRAVFTILDVGTVPRAWLSELQSGQKLGPNCPEVWRRWVATGRPRALKAEKITPKRTAAQQLGRTREQGRIVEAIYRHFRTAPIAFEHFAGYVVQLMDANVVGLDITRPSRDGGRDGVGRYRIGQPQNCITVDFAMEAKCLLPPTGIGVKIISRLISRLRHRQFGVLVTTSYLADQAYQEVIDDQHPIVVCSGGDVADLLVSKLGLNTAVEVATWLGTAFPLGSAPDPGDAPAGDAT